VRVLTDPQTATDATTRLAMSRIAAMLPRLSMRKDSVEARYYRGMAYLLLDRTADGCRELRAIAPQARIPRVADAINALLEGDRAVCK
jgi:hypothetical protein